MERHVSLAKMLHGITSNADDLAIEWYNTVIEIGIHFRFLVISEIRRKKEK
jgi:hypothetical protein